MISLLYLIVSASAVAMLVAWGLLALLYPAVRRMGKNPSAFTSGFWFGIGTLPAAAGLLAGVFAIGSGVPSAAGWLTDHCSEHAGHPHLCASHIAASPPEGNLFWSFMAGSLALVVHAAFRVCQSSARTNSHLSKSSTRREGGFHVFPSRIPAAFTAGLLSPSLF
ncbi:MAG: hypothetical protein ACRD1R_03770 [Acidobacteriota bacterium]